MTIAEKLLTLDGIKDDIKVAIEAKGVDCTDAKFSDYGDKILEITGGGIEIVGAVNRQVKLGETLSAGAAIDVIGNVWGSSYKKNDNPDVLPSYIAYSCAMSADGQFLAVGLRYYFVTYKWSAINNRYEKTNSHPDNTDFDSGCSANAMSANGQFLFIGASKVGSYKWSEENNRYEKTADPSFIPSGYAPWASMSADGQFLAVANTASPYLFTYKWSEVNNRYEQTNNPDISPGGCKSCAMSADGQFLAAANTASPYLSIYKWSAINNRYEKTNNPDIDPGGGSSCAMSADGKFLAVGHVNAGPPAYLTTYKWSDLANRYEQTNNPDFAPSGVVIGVGISADGTYLVASHDGTVQPAKLVTYKWSVENARYEQMNYPNFAPQVTPVGSIGISSDGKYCAVAHQNSNSPKYLITYKLNIEGHDLKAYASQNKMWRMNSHYTGVLSEAGEAGDIVAAKMLTKTPADPLEVFGPNPGEE